MTLASPGAAKCARAVPPKSDSPFYPPARSGSSGFGASRAVTQEEPSGNWSTLSKKAASMASNGTVKRGSQLPLRRRSRSSWRSSTEDRTANLCKSLGPTWRAWGRSSATRWLLLKREPMMDKHLRRALPPSRALTIEGDGWEQKGFLVRRSLYGEVFRVGRIGAHVMPDHLPPTFVPGSRPDSAKRPRYPRLNGVGDHAHERGARKSSREPRELSSDLSPSSETVPIRERGKERCWITAEPLSRDGTGLHASHGRWYRGPGKVRL